MAIDKKLQIFDDEGNPVDYDILASDVKFNDGKDLPTKLAEMEEEIGEGGYTPPAGGIPKTDLAPSVQQTLDDVANKVNKETGKGLSTNDYTTEDKTKLAGLPTNPVQSISVNGTAQSKDANGNVNIQVQTGEQVSVIQPTNPDGTFTIRVGETDYTINLNHTHEGMAKLEKVTAATLPDVSEMADDTIYVQVDNATTPTEIEALHIFGLEFTGGGLPAGTPQITKPKNTIPFNLGTAYGQGGATGTVTVKGKNLTANSLLTVSVGNGFSLSYGQQSGSSITISAADATIGADVDVFATAYGTTGALLITSQTDNINHAVDLTSDVYEELAGVKLTGTQWLQTDYKPNANTQFDFEVKFTSNNDTLSPTNDAQVVLSCPNNTGDGKRFRMYHGKNSGGGTAIYQLYLINESSVYYGNQSDGNLQKVVFDASAEDRSAFEADNAVISYIKGSSNGTLQLVAGGVTKSHATSLKSSTMESAMKIGISEDNTTIYYVFDLTIYSLKIYEGGTTDAYLVRHYVPRTRNGVPGLLDIAANGSGEFISSETASPLEVVTSSNS